jgi:glycine oxidase
MAVTLVDPHPGRGATWAAAGMLAPVGEAQFGEDRLTALNVVAARRWPTFADSLEKASGRCVHYLAAGTLLVAVDASDRAATDDLLAYRTALGLAAGPLTGSECRRLEPLLVPGIRGGADLADDHQVDNRALVDALIVACRATGVNVLEDEVVALDINGGSVSGVALRLGHRIPTGAVVVAAGCHSGQLGGVPEHLRPPVRPVKGLTLRLRAPEGQPTLRRTVRGLVHGRSCYLVPRRDRTVVVGASVEERGFDLSVRAGAVGDLLDDARRIIPTLEEYELVETSTGLRPGSPDNAPLVGATDVSGLVMATGHYRNGILLAPSTAHEVVRILTDGKTAAEGAFADFAPDRFEPVAGRAPTGTRRS